MSHKDPVSSWVADIVARRDEFKCVAPRIDGRTGWCHDVWGNVITRWPANRLDKNKVTIAHVKDADAQAMGKRAPSDQAHLLLLCWGHHEGAGETGGYCWGTSRAGLDKQRTYLAGFHALSPRTPMP